MDTRAAPPTRDPRLDALRGFAVLAVLLFHTTLYGAERTRLDSALSALPSLGWSGVDLFFVLSGFLITRILLATRDSSAYYATFWARRALRIVPAYYVFLAVTLLIVPRIEALAPLSLLWHPNGPPEGPWYWLYLSNWSVAIRGAWDSQALSVLWSLAIEEQFYLLWPWVVLRFGERRLLPLGLALAAGALALRTGLVFGGVDPIAVYVATPCRIDPLAIGAVIAVLSRRTGGLAPYASIARKTLFVSFWAFATIALYLRADAPVRTIEAVTQNMTPWIQTIGYSLLAVGFGSLLIVVQTATSGSLLARIFESRFLRALGRVSYMLYLVQVAVFAVAKRALLPELLELPYPIAQLAMWLTVGVASYAIAWLSWVALESRVLGWKRHFPYRI